MSENRSTIRRWYAARGAVLLGLVVACAPAPRKLGPSAERCRNFRVQSKQWTGGIVREGLLCLLGSESKFYGTVRDKSDGAFNQTAAWLNAGLSNTTTRAALWGSLEEFPTSLGPFFSDAENATLLTDRVLFESFDRIQPGLQLAALNDGRLIEHLAAAFRLWSPSASSMPTREALDAFLDIAAKSAALPRADRGDAFLALAEIDAHLEARPSLNALFTRLARADSCAPGLRVQPPFQAFLEVIRKSGPDPRAAFAAIGPAFVAWKSLCRPTEAGADQLLEFAAENMPLFQRLARTDATPWGTPMATLLEQADNADRQRAASDANAPTLLTSLAASGFAEVFLKTLALPDGPGHAWVETLDENRGAYLKILTLPSAQVDRIFRIPAPDFARLVKSVTRLGVNGALLNEWQDLFISLGPDAFEGFGRFVSGEGFAEAARRLRRWTREEAYAPNEEPLDFPLPSFPLPTEFDRDHTERALALVRQCLTASSRNWATSIQCLARETNRPAIANPFVTDPAFTRFIDTLSPDDPILEIGTATAELGWLGQSSPSMGRFASNTMRAFDGLALDPGRILHAFSTGAALPPETLRAAAALTARVHLPEGRPGRLVWLGYADETDRVEGLPPTWATWMRTDFVTGIVRALDSIPGSVDALRAARRIRIQATLVNKAGVSGDLTMNAVEVFDTLLWESQAKPFFGAGDRMLMSKILSDLQNLRTDDDVVEWLNSSERLLRFGLPFARWIPGADGTDTVRRIENALRLVPLLRSNVPPHYILIIAQLVSKLVPANWSQTEQVALITQLHRLCLLPSLSEWIGETFDIETRTGRPWRYTPAIAQSLIDGFNAFLENSSEAEFLQLGRLNRATEGRIAATGLSIFGTEVWSGPRESLVFSGRLLGSLVMAPLASIGGLNAAESLPRMTRLARNAQPLLEDITRRWGSPTGGRAWSRLARFAASRTRGQSLESLRRLSLVVKIADPAVRQTLIPWLESPEFDALLTWAQLIHDAESSF